MSTRDESRPVREEDAFDVDAVAAWLRQQARDSDLGYDLAGNPISRTYGGDKQSISWTWDGKVDSVSGFGDEGKGALLYFEIRHGTETLPPSPWLGI